MRNSPPSSLSPITVDCVRCGRAVATHAVTIYRFSFPANRLCDVCRAAELAESQQNQADVRFDRAMIPRSYRDCAFSNFSPTTNNHHGFAIAQQWVDQLRAGHRPQRGLLLRGSTGSGKTHLAVSVVREATYSDRLSRCLFMSVPQWLIELRTTWTSREHMEIRYPDGYEIVVIDDLRHEDGTDWSRDRLYGLINHLEQSQALIIATTTMQSGDIDDRLGKGAARRLGRLCKDVPLDGNAPADQAPMS